MPILLRIKKVTGGFSKEKIDALLVTNPANVRYLSGYRGCDASLFITNKEKFIITDSRFLLQAKADTEGFEVRIINNSYLELVSGLVHKFKVRRLGFESDNLTYSQYERLSKQLSGAVTVPVSDIVESLRQIKDADEILLIRKSVSILKEAVTRIKAILKPGLTERDLAAEADRIIRACGGDKSSFEIIAASGKNSAFPHACPGKRKIKPNDMVLLDLGVNYEGYNSDLTRLFFLGKINPKAKRVYDTVREANRRSIEAIRPGVEISRIDQIARGFICKKGFGGCFSHALGHGIGLEVHEKPSISGKNHNVLKSGMIFTVEPAVYLPGWGGVRVEDMVLVTKKGYEVLTDDIDK